MATKPDSLMSQPNFSWVVVRLTEDTSSSNKNGGSVLEWFSSSEQATSFAKSQAAILPAERFAIFECSQVFGAVQKVEMLYSRRG